MEINDHFSPGVLGAAEKTIEKFLARAVRLYEQEQGEAFGPPLLGLYMRRRVRRATEDYSSYPV